MHVRRIVSFAMSAFIFAASASAQTVTLRGRALDPDGRPVASLEVLMHRVADGAGANVARDTTDATGAFALSAPSPAGDSAIYFAATRFNDELFVGPFVRAPFEVDPDYVLEVGGEPFSLAGPAAPSSPVVTPSPSPAGRPWLAIVALLALAGVAIAAGLRRTQPSRYRRQLMRLAAIDEDRDRDRSRERDRIMEQLLSR